MWEGLALVLSWFWSHLRAMCCVLALGSKFGCIKITGDSGSASQVSRAGDSDLWPETPTFTTGDSDLYGRRLRTVRKLRGKQTGDSGPFGSVMTEISTSLIPLDILDMCAYLLCCFPTIIFTGGSRSRTKAAAHRHGKNPRHQARQSQIGRAHV